MKKIIALLLAVSLLAINCATIKPIGRERKFMDRKQGADLLIQKKGGPEIEGELIAVKKNSLLLLDSELGADVSVEIGDIRLINIRKKSRVGKGILYGFFYGGGFGALFGFLDGDDPPGWFSMTASQKALIGGASFGLIGAAIGGISGAFADPYKTIRIDEMSDSQVQGVLEKLRSKARIPDYQ